MTTTAFNITLNSSGRALVKSGLSRNNALQNRALTRLNSGRTMLSPSSASPSNSLQWSSSPRRWNSGGNVGTTSHPHPTTSSPGVPSTAAGTAKQGTSPTVAKSTASKAGDAAKQAAGKMRNASAGAEGAGAAGEQQTMDWNSYFQLRRTRRNYERAFMVPCAVAGLGGAGYYFANKDFDPTPIFGMDQVVVYAVGTVAAGIVGLAMAPVVGNMVFRATHSKAKPLLDRMDTEFYKHIVKNRADPTANSVRNPVPDYYGEKIKSVSEYRKWLRKQREYRRKATFFVGVD